MFPPIPLFHVKASFSNILCTIPNLCTRVWILSETYVLLPLATKCYAWADPVHIQPWLFFSFSLSIITFSNTTFMMQPKHLYPLPHNLPHTPNSKDLFLPFCLLWWWRKQWHPTPVLLPGKYHGWRSLVGCSPWGREESDMTEWLHFHFSLSGTGGGNGNPLQCSCLENPRDGGAWWAAIYGVAQSWTRLKRLSSSSCFGELKNVRQDVFSFLLLRFSMASAP